MTFPFLSVQTGLLNMPRWGWLWNQIRCFFPLHLPPSWGAYVGAVVDPEIYAVNVLHPISVTRNLLLCSHLRTVCGGLIRLLCEKRRRESKIRFIHYPIPQLGRENFSSFLWYTSLCVPFGVRVCDMGFPHTPVAQSHQILEKRVRGSLTSCPLLLLSLNFAPLCNAFSLTVRQERDEGNLKLNKTIVLVAYFLSLSPSPRLHEAGKAWKSDKHGVTRP